MHLISGFLFSGIASLSCPSEVQKIISKWRRRSYPQDIKTIGEHIRKRRVEKNVLQSDVAQILANTLQIALLHQA